MHAVAHAQDLSDNFECSLHSAECWLGGLQAPGPVYIMCGHALEPQSTVFSTLHHVHMMHFVGYFFYLSLILKLAMLTLLPSSLERIIILIAWCVNMVNFAVLLMSNLHDAPAHAINFNQYFCCEKKRFETACIRPLYTLHSWTSWDLWIKNLFDFKKTFWA